MYYFNILNIYFNLMNCDYYSYIKMVTNYFKYNHLTAKITKFVKNELPKLTFK